MQDSLKTIIERAWEKRDLILESETQQAIRAVIDLLDKGEVRVAEHNGS